MAPRLKTQLFERVGFPKRDIDKMAIALANTHRILWVRSTTSSRLARQGQLVGFARATGDGALSATIWDVAVNPAWQRIGLGRALMERLTAALVADGITDHHALRRAWGGGAVRAAGICARPRGAAGDGIPAQGCGGTAGCHGAIFDS